MINIATKEDLVKVKALGKDKTYLKDAGIVYYCLFEGEDLKAYVASLPLVIKLGQHLLKSSDIIDIVDTGNSKDREELLRAVNDYREHTELLSFSKLADYTLVELGYMNVYPKVSYTFDKNRFKYISTINVKELSDVSEALDAYAKMVRSFDGYIFRDFSWFNTHVKNKGDLFRISKDAYFSLRVSGEDAFIDEIVYSYLEEVDVAISYALNYAKKVTVTVSAHERLERYYKEVDIGPTFYTLGRINDLERFNKLDEGKFTDIKKALAMSGRAIRLDD